MFETQLQDFSWQTNLQLDPCADMITFIYQKIKINTKLSENQVNFLIFELKGFQVILIYFAFVQVDLF